jgi:hypothetical protein
MQGLRVADEVWVALAFLHRDHPHRPGFRSREILERAQALHPGIPCRRGVQVHISGHCVANHQPSPNRLRYLYRNLDGTYRLYRDGDDYHPRRRNGRTAPPAEALPDRYKPLVQWYWSDYNRPHAERGANEEPLVRIEDMKVADEVWLALALLHMENSARDSFRPAEIAARAQQLHPGVPCRPGVMPHIYSHCVANAEPTAGRYRMFYRNADGTLRLYRDGDDYHSERHGSKTAPQRSTLPEEYREVHDWYFREYNKRQTGNEDDDPLMQLVGLGADVWKRLGGGDAFIRWQRQETPTIPLGDADVPLPRHKGHAS